MDTPAPSTIIPTLRYRDAHAAIDWLCRAFGFERHAVYADGDVVHHAQLTFGATVRGKPLPSWAGEVGADSWAQLFLKFALGHPAVTVVIPATGKPRNQRDNLRAGVGPMLDARQRAALIEAVGG